MTDADESRKSIANPTPAMPTLLQERSLIPELPVQRLEKCFILNSTPLLAKERSSGKFLRAVIIQRMQHRLSLIQMMD